MRTEKEINERIEELDKKLIRALQLKRTGALNSADFELLYSDVWDEELALYWVLGCDRRGAVMAVGKKFWNMTDELE